MSWITQILVFVLALKSQLIEQKVNTDIWVWNHNTITRTSIIITKFPTKSTNHQLLEGIEFYCTNTWNLNTIPGA